MPIIAFLQCGRLIARSTYCMFEYVQPSDDRPRQAIGQVHAWVRGEITMTQARTAAGHAMGAARALSGAAREAAYAAGQAAAVAQPRRWLSRGGGSCGSSRTGRSCLRDQGRTRGGS